MSGNNNQFGGIGQGVLQGLAPQFKGQSKQLLQGNTPSGLSIPAKSSITSQLLQQQTSQPQEPSMIDQVKESFVKAAQQGAQAYIGVMSKVDPATADDMKAALISQKSSIMGGVQDTSEMTPDQYKSYLMKTKKLGDIANSIQSSGPVSEQEIAYQQNIDKIKAIDPNAPNRYNPNYVAIAAIDANPINKAIQGNPELATTFDAPLNKDQLASINPKLAEKVSSDSANLIFKNDSGTYQVFKSLTPDGKETYTVDNNGKVKTLDPTKLNTISSAESFPGGPKAFAEFQKNPQEYNRKNFERLYKNANGVTPEQQAMIANIQRTDDPNEKQAYQTILSESLKADVEARAAAQDNAYKMAQIQAVNGLKANSTGGKYLTTATKNDLQKQYTDGAQTLRQLKNIAESMTDEDIQKALTIDGKIKLGIATGLDRIGLGSADAFGLLGDKNAAEWVETKGVLDGKVGMLFNLYRKNITGAAAAVQELEQLKKAYINGDMSPSLFRTRFNDILAQTENNLGYINEALETGILPEALTDVSRYEVAGSTPNVNPSIATEMTLEELMAERARRNQQPQQ